MLLHAPFISISLIQVLRFSYGYIAVALTLNGRAKRERMEAMLDNNRCAPAA